MFSVIVHESLDGWADELILFYNSGVKFFMRKFFTQKNHAKKHSKKIFNIFLATIFHFHSNLSAAYIIY